VLRCECQQRAPRERDGDSLEDHDGPAQGASVTLDEVEFAESWRKHIRPPRPGAPAFDAGQPARVEVWIAPVRSLVSRVGGAAVLSADEARQFRQVRARSARDSMMAGRMLLRLALSRTVAGRIAPQDWRLRASPSGKPEITPDLPQVHFSVAHTERLAVIATSQQLPVGIDAETIEQTVESDVTAHFCCPGERAALQKLPQPHSTREFLRLWTLKEAYAKLTGLGAAIDFASVGLSLDTLRLAHAPAFGEDLQVHFETMFVANGNGLTHVALAIALSRSISTRAELQVMTLANDATGAAIHVPCVSSRVGGPVAAKGAS
jgi:phosphopantetheinyl transferase